MNRPIIQIPVGTRFGHTTVLRRISPNCRQRNAHYECICDCGNTSTPTATSLKTGNTKSCGRCHKFRYCVPEAALHRAYRTYKRGAIRKQVSFSLTFPDFSALVTQSCTYCGEEPSVNSYSADVKTKVPMTGIDRRNSDLGYFEENCVPCCGTCNLAKLDTSEADFKAWIQRVYQHLFRG